MKKRLSKVLAAAGVASRRASEELIFHGKVSVNDQIICTPQTLVDPQKDKISVYGSRIAREEKKVYYLLNKPLGYVCTSIEKKGGARRVLDIFSHLSCRLFTAGRLDQETTGLILVTNDGEFANRAIHPSFNHSKEYLAKTRQEITFEHLQTLSKGMRIQNTFVKPISVKKVRRGTLKIIISEGKKHEVRELLAAAGLEIRELCRLRIGPVTLGKLEVGQFRELTPQEISSFQ